MEWGLAREESELWIVERSPGIPSRGFFSQPPKTDKAKSPDKQQEGQQEIISPDGSFDTLARDPNRMVQQVRIS